MAGFKAWCRSVLFGAALISTGVVATERDAGAAPFSTTEIAVAQTQWQFSDSSWPVATAGGLVLVATEESKSVRLFSKSGAGFLQTDTLTPSDPNVAGGYGRSAALTTERAVVGAYNEVNAAGIRTGAVYTYQHAAGGWTPLAELFPSSGLQNGAFGEVLAMSGDRLVVGARGEGRVYVFDWVAGVWQETAKLALSGVRAVATDGNRVVAGGLLGTQNAVYVFDCTQTGCTQSGLLGPTPPDVNVRLFGQSVAVSGTRIVVGAPDNAVSPGLFSGRTFAYGLVGTSWTPVATLSDRSVDSSRAFGYSVTLSGERVVVGAPVRSDAIAASEGSGNVYVYEWQGGTLPLREKLAGPTNDFLREFGSQIALNGTRLVVSSTIQNDQSPGALVGTGKVEVIELDAPPATPAPASSPVAWLVLTAALAALGFSLARRQPGPSGSG